MTNSIRLVRSFAICAPLVLATTQGCLSKPDNAQPTTTPAAGSTGAFGIVTVDGKQKLYLPLDTPNDSGHGIVEVVDVGVAGNGAAGAPALLNEIDLGGDVATTTSGDANVVIAASTNNNNIWFIDPKTDSVMKKIALDDTFGTSGFSGGGGYVTGIAMDSANHRAILSTWNGFTIVDTNSQQITSTILVPPSENFAFDSVRQRIIAPFYDCSEASNSAGSLPFCNDYKAPDGTPMTDGLVIIDLADANTVYLYQDPTAEKPSSPVGGEPDSAGVDSTTGIAVVPSESGDYQNILDLSQAKFDKASKTVTAPHQYIREQGFTGIAVDPTAHFGFWEEEHSEDVGLANLNDAKNGNAKFVHALMPAVPGGSTWSNMGDPHGIAVATGLADGRPVGFVVNSERTWVARVDLTAMSSVPAPADGLMSDITSAVTYLDARTRVGTTTK